MRTLLLAATALIGVSAAHANPATPAKPAGRYLTLNCATAAKDGASATTEKWTLSFDVNDGHAEFSADGNPETARWGYFTPGPTTATALVGDPKAPMNLAVVFTKGQTARLTWVQGVQSGVMDCRYPAMSDVQPAVWHDPATVPAAAKPTVYDPQVKPAAAPAPAASLSSAPLTFDNQGMNVAVSLGTMPVTMVIDTGAIGMTVSQTVADWLVSNGHATTGPSEKKVMADGGVKEFKTIDIDTLNIAGHELHKVHAGVTPDGAGMLLGLPILAQLTTKFAVDFTSAKLTFL
jgi:gag-polyprotein putative aspartyl protease